MRTGTDGRTALSAASAARIVVAVRGWHRFLVQDGATGRDPARAVKPPAQPKRLPRAISVAEIERLLDAAGVGDGPVPLRDRALLELVYGTGARISEAVGLERRRRGPHPGPGGRPAGGQGKQGARRALWAASRSRPSRSTWSRARPALDVSEGGSAGVFLNTRGARLSRQSAWAVLRVAAERAGLDGAEQISPHTLRHSFATHLLAGGADVRVVQELLGHASVTTTQIYTMVTPDTLREVYAASHPRAR